MRATTFNPVISGQSVTVGATPVMIGCDTGGPAPRITLRRRGGEVTAVEVHCRCGELLVLECVYESAESGAA